MLVKSILNRVQLHHGFVYGAVCWNNRGKRLVLDIEIRARKGSRPICSHCGNDNRKLTTCDHRILTTPGG
jgi:hypothetical protein